MSAVAEHNLYLDTPECFIVFNDDPALPFDQVGGADLTPVRAAPGNMLASMAWSADCRWYFVVVEDGIYLFHTDGDGWFCRKRSACFIELFLNAPKGRRR